MKEIKKIELQDAHLLSILEPDEYDIPTNEEIQDLKAGDIVRVSMFDERLCVKVHTKYSDHFICEIDELPHFVIQDGVEIDDLIRVFPRNIFQIF